MLKPHQFFAMCFACSPLMLSASDAAIDPWLNEFYPSTLSREEQRQELRWFANAAKPFKGMEIRVTSERITTHWYEASVLAKAFYDITGIKVIHELTGEDDVLKKLTAQEVTKQNLYDAYINDSDLIGTHFRSGHVVSLTQFMANEGKSVTSPTLDLNDFIGLKFTTAPDGELYQLPDQQFANLYWYRHDWFNRKDFKDRFREIYGYELGVPQNWQAYEDIAAFFSEDIAEIDGQRIYGHMDYAKTDPSLGWRLSDAWLSMAGVGDTGLPNGLPVDEWGIRVNGCRPAGASVARGGALNSPAAVYAIDKYIEWLQYAPDEAVNLNFSQAGEWPAKGVIAQQIFWYTAFVSDLTHPSLPVVNIDGTPKWRVAPSPLGKYWQKGMKSGYQDTGAWTLLKNTPLKRQQAAWLYAQFVVSKTVSLRKTLVGLTPIRKSDIDSVFMTEQAPFLGGLVEFYRSTGRDVWTPTGTNVPDYPGLSNMWWKNISKIVEGQATTQQGLDDFAYDVDNHLLSLSMSHSHPCSPELNDIRKTEYWLNQPGSPKPRNNKTVKGITKTFEEAINAWR